MKQKILIVFSLILILNFCYATDIESLQKDELIYLEFSEPYFIEEDSQKNTVLIVESAIKKMDVYLNGVFQGRTKLTINGLLPGEYIIELKKGDTSIGKKLITVKSGYILTYKF